MRALLALSLCAVPAAAQSSPSSVPVPEPPEGPAEAGAARMTSVVGDLRRAEYAFAELRPGLFTAPNRANELRCRVSRAGLEVFPRAASSSGAGAAWRVELSTRSFGRVGDAREVDHRGVTTEGHRAEIDHGPLVQWCENGERGIELGWTMSGRPAGVDALEIGLAIAGDLSLRIEETGRSGSLVDARGDVRLRCRALAARDARGRELRASLAPRPGGAGVRIEDDAAVHPVTVDLLVTDPGWTAGSGQADASFGFSVSSAGDVNGDGHADVIVGSPLYDAGEPDEGCVFLFLGSSEGLESSPSWTAESDEAGVQFGYSVAWAGDVNADGYSDVLVGEPFYDGGLRDRGRACLFHGSAAGLLPTPAWSAGGIYEDGHFGISVSSAGDVNGDGFSDVIVGSPDDADSQNPFGHAFVFHGSANGLSSISDWFAISPEGSDGYGICVSTAGDVNGDGYSDVLVGAPYHGIAFGRAYLYLGAPAGLGSVVWIGDPVYGSEYGSSLAGVGDLNGDGYGDVVVGAPSYGFDMGAVYVYLGSSGGLALVAFHSGGANDARAGTSVAAAGDVNGDGFSDYLVGAPGLPLGAADTGAVFVYLGSDDLSELFYLLGSGQTGAAFGQSVAGAGDLDGDGYADVLVGAPDYTSSETNEGCAFVFHGSPERIAPEAVQTMESNQAAAYFGTSASSAGDVNGDGYSDVLVGAQQYDGGEFNEGRAYVYHGSATGPSASPDWTAEPDAVTARFGRSAASAGDVNGDGYADVIIGAHTWSGSVPEEGRAYVFHGSPSGLEASPAWTAESGQEGSYFGYSVSGAGDVNGDGYADVIVGAHRYDDDGRVFVYHGSAAGLSSAPSWTVDSGQASAFFGESVASAGDVNGDGYSDVIVGATRYDNGQGNEGASFVYLGSAQGLGTTPAWSCESDQASAQLGRSVATAGDVNGDGYSDVIVGVFGYDGGQTDEGRALVFHGSAAGLGTSPAWAVEGDQDGAFLGWSLASAGDVDADGYSDVIVGAWRYDESLVDEGRASVYLGSASGLAPAPAWTQASGQTQAFLEVVASAGDVNGDGYSDVLIGTPFYDDGETDEGRVVVHLGNGAGRGQVGRLQQRDRTSSRPIAVLGHTWGLGQFFLRAEFRPGRASFSPVPAPEAWLEWEVKALGAPFDGSGIQRGAPFAVPAPGAPPLVLEEQASLAGQSNEVPYARRRLLKWRARVATNDPLFPHTAWFGMPDDGLTETKLVVPAAPPASF